MYNLRLILIIIWLVSFETHSCSCIENALTLESSYKNSHSVILAKINKCSDTTDNNTECTFSLLDSFKKQAPKVLKYHNYSTCAYAVKPEEKHLLFLPKSGYLNNCTANGKYVPNIKKITTKQIYKSQIEDKLGKALTNQAHYLTQSKYKILQDFKSGKVNDLSSGWQFDDYGFKCKLYRNFLDFNFIYTNKLPQWIKSKDKSAVLDKGKFILIASIENTVHTNETYAELFLDNKLFKLSRHQSHWTNTNTRKRPKYTYFKANQALSYEIYNSIKNAKEIMLKIPLNKVPKNQIELIKTLYPDYPFYILKSHTLDLAYAIEKFETCMKQI